MNAAPFILWLLAAVLGVVAFSRGDGRHRKAIEYAIGQFVILFPLVVLALLTAGFISTLIPVDSIASWIGAGGGLRGILIASAAGALIPGGPVIAFPTAVLVDDSGAGIPQLIAFITSWSVFAVHRILQFELSLIGWLVAGSIGLLWYSFPQCLTRRGGDVLTVSVRTPMISFHRFKINTRHPILNPGCSLSRSVREPVRCLKIQAPWNLWSEEMGGIP